MTAPPSGLCLAHPRLGLSAQRCEALVQYRGPLMAIAYHLLTVRRSIITFRLLASRRFEIDEALLRRYAADLEATAEGCEWLGRQVGARGLRCCIEKLSNRFELWRLRTGAAVEGAILRTDDARGGSFFTTRARRVPSGSCVPSSPTGL